MGLFIDPDFIQRRFTMETCNIFLSNVKEILRDSWNSDFSMSFFGKKKMGVHFFIPITDPWEWYIY